MKKIEFDLPYANLIPDFIYQFFSNEYVEKDSFTCFELEDLRNLIIEKELKGLQDIKNFLAITDEEKQEKEKIDEDIFLSYEFEEIENEYYHRYTPGELRFIFEKIIENIESLYYEFLKFYGITMSFTIGFKLKNNSEINMIIEFIDKNIKSEDIEDAYYLNIDKNYVSDNIKTRVYFIIDKQNEQENFELLKKIIEIIQLKF